MKAVLVKDNIVIAVSYFYPGMKLNKGWLVVKSEREAKRLKVGEFYDKPKYKITNPVEPPHDPTEDTKVRRKDKK
jgi:hypothetical protein